MSRTVKPSKRCGQDVFSRISLVSHFGFADIGGAIWRPGCKSRSAAPGTIP